MSSMIKTDRRLYGCGLNCISFIIFNLIFMIICIVLQNQKSYKYTGAIKDETSEWNDGAIVDIKAVNATYDNLPKNICGDGYELQSASFLGVKDYCTFNSGRYSSLTCSRTAGSKARGSRVYGIP